jgi:hypothetical protein
MKHDAKRTVFFLSLLVFVFLSIQVLSMMSFDRSNLLHNAETMSAAFSETPLATKIVTPAGISAGGSASRSYSVTINDQPVPVERYNSISYVQFAFAGKAEVKVNVEGGADSYTLSPTSYGIPVAKNGDQVAFPITDPSKLILHHSNSSIGELFIFADPLPDNLPQPGQNNVVSILDYGINPQGNTDITDVLQTAIDDASTRGAMLYFPPGLYPTQKLNLKSNLVLYLAEGAVIEASKAGKPAPGEALLNLDNISNVQIMGRGIIRGNGSYWRPQGGMYSLIEVSNANNVVLQDFILEDPAAANIWIEYSENVKVFNTKLLAAPDPYFLNTDGFDFWSSRNILIDNVLYRGTDDATSQGGDKKGAIQNNENINIRNSIFYGGGGFKLGTTVNQDLIRNVTYENIDLIYTNGLAGFWPVTGANFENIYLKNIRVENTKSIPGDANPAELFEWRIQVANWEPTSSPDRLGHIRNVFVNHLTVTNYQGRESLFQGYDPQHNLSNIQFNNFYINDRLVTNLNEGFFKLLPSDRDGATYVDLKFTNIDTPLINIEANSAASEHGNSGQFVVTRTGDLSAPLTINYTIRGTARNGIDYQQIPNSVTFPSGAKTVPIVIRPIIDFTQENLETIWLSLDNLPNSNQYLLGSNFQAVVTLQDS